MPQACVLAYQGLKTTGQIQQGQKVLINGAGGGVGTFAVQIAKRCGTEVTGVDYPHKLDVIKSLGADHVMDCSKEDFTQGGKQFDLILDVFAHRSLLAYKRALTPSGVYAMVGATTLRIAQFLLLKPWTKLTGDSKQIRIVSEGPNKGLAEITELIESDQIAPVIDRTYPLREVSDAMRYFTTGAHKGKIVITMGNQSL